MLTIIRRFRVGARVEFKDEVEKILNELGVDMYTIDYYQTILGGKEIIKVYFNDCSILEDRLKTLINYLDTLPIRAGVTLTY